MYSTQWPLYNAVNSMDTWYFHLFLCACSRTGNTHFHIVGLSQPWFEGCFFTLSSKTFYIEIYLFFMSQKHRDYRGVYKRHILKILGKIKDNILQWNFIKLCIFWKSNSQHHISIYMYFNRENILTALHTSSWIWRSKWVVLVPRKTLSTYCLPHL